MLRFDANENRAAVLRRANKRSSVLSLSRPARNPAAVTKDVQPLGPRPNTPSSGWRGLTTYHPRGRREAEGTRLIVETGDTSSSVSGQSLYDGRAVRSLSEIVQW